MSKYFIEYENNQHIESAINHMIRRGEAELTHGSSLKEAREYLEIDKNIKERNKKLDKLLDD